jgi:hypothetical protein
MGLEWYYPTGWRDPRRPGWCDFAPQIFSSARPCTRTLLPTYNDPKLLGSYAFRSGFGSNWVGGEPIGGARGVHEDKLESIVNVGIGGTVFWGAKGS